MTRSEPAGLTEELFRERLGETIAWCTPRVDVIHPRTCLRSDETRPRILEPDYFAAVASVASGRRGPSRDPFRGPNLPGRLVIYFPASDLACGGAEQASRGYFDVNNAPPWDTWVAMVQDEGEAARGPYLVAWVPDPFVELAGRGIWANPESCIVWWDDAEVALRQVVDVTGVSRTRRD